jgi:hypothetical protein
MIFIPHQHELDRMVVDRRMSIGTGNRREGRTVSLVLVVGGYTAALRDSRLGRGPA